MQHDHLLIFHPPEVPVAIRSQISKHYEDAYNLSRHIQRTMFCTTQGLHELELRKSNNRTSRDYPAVPDISHVMEPVLHDIFRLSRMPETDALDLAVQAMAKFAQRYRGGEWSADDDSKGKCAADRPADMLLHAMLAKLVKHHNGLAPAWLWEELEGTRAVLECHGLEKGYFEGTFAAFERWQSEGLVA